MAPATWEWGPWASQSQQADEAAQKAYDARKLQDQKDAADMARQQSVNEANNRRVDLTAAANLRNWMAEQGYTKQQADQAESQRIDALQATLQGRAPWREQYGTQTAPAVTAIQREGALAEPEAMGISAPITTVKPAQYDVSREQAQNLYRASGGKLGEELLKPPPPPKPQGLIQRDPTKDLYDPNTNRILLSGIPKDEEGYTQEEAQNRADVMNRQNPKAFTGIASDSKGKWHVVQHPPPASMQGPQLTDPALDAAADYYNKTGGLPTGMSRNMQAQNRVMNRAAELRSGMPADLAAKTAGFKADVGALQALGKQEALVGSFVKNLDRNAVLAERLSDRVDRSGSPVINRWILAGRQNVAGDSDVAAFHVATMTVVNEYAKIMSNASGGGQNTSDSARKEAMDMLNTAQTPAQFHAVLGVMHQETQNRLAGYTAQRGEINGRLGIQTPVLSPEDQKRQRQQATMDKYR